MASCKNTWETFQHVRRERLLLIAITEADCPRLPLHEALTVTINCVRTIFWEFFTKFLDARLLFILFRCPESESVLNFHKLYWIFVQRDRSIGDQ